MVYGRKIIQGGASSVPANETIYVVTPSIDISTYLAGFANHNGIGSANNIITLRYATSSGYNVVYAGTANATRGGKYVIFGLA